jgi:hypothetical protein
MQPMNTNHRTVVPAPAWALQALRERSVRNARLLTQAPPVKGLEVAECPFEAWLAAGGERRQLARPLHQAASAD